MRHATQAEYLIGRFGGINPMARTLGLTPSVVQGWKERGTIPTRRNQDIMDAGRQLDPPLQYREFFERPDGRAHLMRVDRLPDAAQ